jgi:hypothetical protein
MSTDGPQPTQGAPKKKKEEESRSVVFWGCFFVPCFLFFGPPLLRSKQGTTSRKTSNSTEKLNGQNPLGIAIANALELLRGQNFEN